MADLIRLRSLAQLCFALRMTDGCLHILSPFSFREREAKMLKPPVHKKPVLTIDLNVRFRSRIYQISLTQIVRWVPPILVIVIRVIAYFRDNAS